MTARSGWWPPVRRRRGPTARSGRLTSGAVAAVVLALGILGGAVQAASAEPVTVIDRGGGPGLVHHVAWVSPLGPPGSRPDVVHPFSLPYGPYGAGNRGVDLRGAAGEVVRSAGDGFVSFAGVVAGRPVVAVTHAGGLRTTYEPVDPAVRAGSPVTAGSVLGRLVSTASHCAPVVCLHWGALRGDNDYLDPLLLLTSGPARLVPVTGHLPVGILAPAGLTGGPRSTATQIRGVHASAAAVPPPESGSVPGPAGAVLAGGLLAGGLVAGGASLTVAAPRRRQRRRVGAARILAHPDGCATQKIDCDAAQGHARASPELRHSRRASGAPRPGPEDRL